MTASDTHPQAPVKARRCENNAQANDYQRDLQHNDIISKQSNIRETPCSLVIHSRCTLHKQSSRVVE